MDFPSLHRTALALSVVFTAGAAPTPSSTSTPPTRRLGAALLFFPLHGLATAATPHLRPTGPLRLLATRLTLAFTLAASLLFFHCINALLLFYTTR